MQNLVTLYMDAIPKANKEMRKNFRSSRGNTLSVPQFRVLIQLRKKSQCNKSLAEHIGLSVAAMSRLVQGLEKKKLVEKRAERKDRRQAHIDLSKRGRLIVSKIRKTVGHKLEGKLSTLNSADQQKLREGLSILSQLFPSDESENEEKPTS